MMRFFKKRRGRKTLSLPVGWKRYVASLPFGGFAESVEEAYRQNAVVWACMTILQNAFPEPELWAWERGERNALKPIQGHEIRRLMARPNPDMGEAELLQYVITYAPLGGNVYLWKQRDARGRVTALWPLHDGQMRPVAGKSIREGMTAYYVWLTETPPKNPNPYGIERHEDDHLQGIPIPKSEVIHWKWAVDPLHPERGMSALEAISGDVRIGNEVRDYLYSHLKNDAVPPLIVTLTEGDELTEEKAKRLRKLWRQAFSGPNRGTPAFLEYGMTAQTLGASLSELRAGDLTEGPEAAICAAFHIHPSVVGTLAGLRSSTYSNYEEANRALALQTLTPLWRSFASEVQQGLAGEPGYAEDVVIRFDLAQVRALQDSQNAIEERLGRAFDRGGITRAEYRRALGYETTEEDEVFKENLASVWVPRGMLRTADPELLAAEEARQDGKGTKAGGAKGAEAQATAMGAALRRIRSRMLPEAEAQIAGYFRGLAQRVMEEVEGRKWKVESGEESGKWKVESRKWNADDAGDLLRRADGGELERLLGGLYQTILELSWETWSAALGVYPAFDLTDPVVTAVLALAGEQVRGIHETTRQALAEVLQTAAAEGWDVEMLAYGNPETGARGIVDVVEETYQGRARAIARTELGTAQNTATVMRYEQAGVGLVMVLDNGEDDDDGACKVANGQVWTLDYFRAHLLEHPNCTRAAAPYFGERKPDKE